MHQLQSNQHEQPTKRHERPFSSFLKFIDLENCNRTITLV